MGYEGVELAGLGPIEPDRLGALLRETELTACSAHVRWERLRDQTSAAIEACRAWGCTHVAVPVLPQEYRSAEGYARFAVEASGGAAALRDAGIRLAHHNHAYE